MTGAPGDAVEPRGRFGLMVIHNDGVPEDEMRMMAPADIGIYVARFQSPRQKGHEYRDDRVRAFAQSRDLVRAAEMLGSMPLDCIGIAYASGCLISGMGWDESVAQAVTELTGRIPTVGAATATVAAWQALGLRSPLVVVPAWFGNGLVEAAADFGSELDLHIESVVRADMGPEWIGLEPREIYDRGGGWRQDPRRLERFIESAIGGDADGVVVLGSGLRVVEVISSLEARIARPVVTPQQALLWYWLRGQGIDGGGEGYGRLFTCPLP